MRCPNCQKELGENVRFCTACGCRMPGADIQPGFNDMQQSPPAPPAQPPAVCAACGAPLVAGVRFCTACGSRVGGATPYLIRCRDNTMIPVDCTEFTIGKKQGAVNYCIADNRAVSRVHAKLLNTGGQFGVVDLESTNHTYVDGVRIPVNTVMPIASGTKLRFANEEFEFKIL